MTSTQAGDSEMRDHLQYSLRHILTNRDLWLLIVVRFNLQSWDRLFLMMVNHIQVRWRIHIENIC